MTAPEALLARLGAYAALVFDLDGTLVDSMHLHLAAWEGTALEHGLVFDREAWRTLAGLPSHTIARMLAERQAPGLEVAALAAAKNRRYYASIGEVRPIVASVNLVQAAFGRWPMAVATGTARVNLDRILADTALGGFFAATVSADDIAHPKPHPESFLLAADRLRVPPRDCLVFEDTETGFAAAAAAGMACVPVRSGEICWNELRSGTAA